MAGTRVEHELRAAGGGRAAGGRRALLAGLALLLVACIGLGSATPLWDVGGPPRLADPDAYAGDALLVGFVLLAVLPFVVPLIRRRRRRRFAEPDPDVEPVRLPWWGRVLRALAIAAVVFLSLLLLSLFSGPDRSQEQSAEPPSGPAEPATDAQPTDPGGLPPVHWWGILLLALVVLAAAAAAWYLRERPVEAEPDEPDELVAAVELSLEDLERDPDPRRAVIRAYARMERALGAHGLPRRPSETALEYLARALTSLHVGRASVERLTALFERAKFSRHEIDGSMKDEALAALSSLRDELAGAAT
jgi:hypothetical protein